MSQEFTRSTLVASLTLGSLLAYLGATAQPQGLPPAPTSPELPRPVSRVPQTPNAVTRARVMGDFQYQRGEYDDAIHSYRQGLQLDPSNLEIRQRLRKTIQLCKAENSMLGEDFRCGAVPPAPKSATQARVMGDSQFKRGEYDEAIDSYKKGLKLAPSSAELHKKLDAAMHACQNDRVTLPVPFTCGARIPLVKLIPPASYPRVVHPGVTEEPIPADDIERILQPIDKLTVPPSSNAPPGAFVVFAMDVGISDNGILGQAESDENGLAPLVLSAAKAWKFRPPMVRGKPVSISVRVIVIF